MASDSPLRVGIAGFGEVGRAFAEGYRAQGLTDLIAFDPAASHPLHGDRIRESARLADVQLVDSPALLASRVDVILAAVPGSASEQLFDSCELDASVQCYADFSTSTAAIKRHLAQKAESVGVAYVDAAIVGPVSLLQHRVPIMISGGGARLFSSLFSQYEMDLQYVSDRAGDAIAIKLIRSIFTKGLGAVLWETVLAADKAGVLDPVLDSIVSSMSASTFDDHVNRALCETAFHAERRAVEAGSSAEQVAALGVDPMLTRATVERLHMLASFDFKARFSGRVPREFRMVLRAMDEEH